MVGMGRDAEPGAALVFSSMGKRGNREVVDGWGHSPQGTTVHRKQG